jgi:hypothetical protein
MREREMDGDEIFEPLDRVPIVTVNRLGPKITVVLDRPMRKRCEFLVLRRKGKDGTGHYEQVFFRTETAIRAHRSRGRLELSVEAALEIAIDQRERFHVRGLLVWSLTPGSAPQKTPPVSGSRAFPARRAARSGDHRSGRRRTPACVAAHPARA